MSLNMRPPEAQTTKAGVLPVRAGAGVRPTSVPLTTERLVFAAVHSPMAVSISVTRATRPSLRARPGSEAKSSRPMACIRRRKMLSPLPATSTQAPPAQA